MKNPLVFYNNNTEPVEFTLNITEPDALFKANKGTPTIVACGKSAVIVNIVCANKCALNNDNITVLVKDGVDLTINEKRSSSNGKLTVSGSGVTDDGIYSLNLADEGASNRLTIKLTCTDDAGGRNSGTISSELRDSLGKTYREWSISRYNVDDENESVSYTYNLGQNIPTMFILKPDEGSETLTKVPMSKYQFDRYLHASLEGHYLEFDEDSEASEKNKAGKLNTEYEESLVTHLTKWDKAMAIIEITSMIYSGIWMITDGLVKLATGATFTAVVWGWATTLWAMGGIAGEEKDNGAQAKRDPSMIYQRKQYISGIYVGVGDTHAKAIAAVYAKIAAASGKTTLLSELDEVVFYSLGSKIGNTWYRRSGAKEEGEKYAYIGVTRTDSRSEAIYGLLKYYTDSDNNPEELTVNAKCRNLLTEEGRIVLDKNTTLSPEAFDHNYRSFKADYEYVNKKIVPEAHAKFEEGYDLALSNADKARMWEYIGAGVSIAFGLMAVAGGIMKIIELATYYDPEFEQIPRYIVDEKDITRQDESGFTIVLHNDYAYYKIVTCNRKAKGTSGDADHNWWTSGAQKNVDKYTEWGCGDYSDLNGDVGKGWLALYTETNPNHDPIEAGTFVVKFNDEVPSGYDNAIHLFGDNSAVNLNSSRWDFNADKTYVYYKTYNLHTITHGDVNKDGIINVKDVTEIRRYAAQYIELDETAIASTDVTGDGSATISDATRIQSYLVDFISLDELVVRNG